MGLNQCTFIGNLGGMPRSKKLDDGREIMYVDLAITEITTISNEKRSKTTWITVKIPPGIVEAVGRFLHTGQSVAVIGKVGEWTDKTTGERKYGFNAIRVILLGDAQGWDRASCTLTPPTTEKAKIVKVAPATGDDGKAELKPKK